MDEALKLLLTILTTIITILLTLVANGVRVIYNKQKDLETIIFGVQQTVNEITEWKDRVQRNEIASKDEEIKELRDQVKELTKV